MEREKLTRLCCANAVTCFVSRAMRLCACSRSSWHQLKHNCVLARRSPAADPHLRRSNKYSICQRAKRNRSEQTRSNARAREQKKDAQPHRFAYTHRRQLAASRSRTYNFQLYGNYTHTRNTHPRIRAHTRQVYNYAKLMCGRRRQRRTLVGLISHQTRAGYQHPTNCARPSVLVPVGGWGCAHVCLC